MNKQEKKDILHVMESRCTDARNMWIQLEKWKMFLAKQWGMEDRVKDHMYDGRAR